jgi:metal-sulfur cluster biosynthetic enzyme
MTMTTAACPLGESITEEAKTAIRQHVRGVTSVSVDLVWEPPWQPSMMSETARVQLGWR